VRHGIAGRPGQAAAPFGLLPEEKGLRHRTLHATRRESTLGSQLPAPEDRCRQWPDPTPFMSGGRLYCECDFGGKFHPGTPGTCAWASITSAAATLSTPDSP
jgi:hypothetical protein